MAHHRPRRGIGRQRVHRAPGSNRSGVGHPRRPSSARPDVDGRQGRGAIRLDLLRRGVADHRTGRARRVARRWMSTRHSSLPGAGAHAGVLRVGVHQRPGSLVPRRLPGPAVPYELRLPALCRSRAGDRLRPGGRRRPPRRLRVHAVPPLPRLVRPARHAGGPAPVRQRRRVRLHHRAHPRHLQPHPLRPARQRSPSHRRGPTKTEREGAVEDRHRKSGLQRRRVQRRVPDHGRRRAVRPAGRRPGLLAVLGNGGRKRMGCVRLGRRARGLQRGRPGRPHRHHPGRGHAPVLRRRRRRMAQRERTGHRNGVEPVLVRLVPGRLHRGRPRRCHRRAARRRDAAVRGQRRRRMGDRHR